MFRKTITATAVAAASVVLLPGAAQAQGVQAAAKLEATAVVQSDKAVDLARSNAAKAEAAVQRSEAAIKRAFTMTVDEGRKAYVSFSAAAEAQGDNLAAVVDKARGDLKKEAADAMATTGRLEAQLVSKLSKQLENSDQASAQQGDTAASVGDSHASLTADIAVTASEANLRGALQRELDAVTKRSVEAQARLAAAVAELRERSEGQGEQSMATAEGSLADSVSDLVALLRSGGRWDVSYDKTVGGENDPVQVSVAARAHASVGQGGRR